MRQTGTMSRGVTLRGLRGSSLLVAPLWRALGPELNPGLKAMITLLGAGTVGVYIMFKCAPKILAVKSPALALEYESISSVPVEQFFTVPGLQNTGNNCFLNVILQALASSETLLNFMDACAALSTETEAKTSGKDNKGKVAMPLAIAVSSLIKELSQLEIVQSTSSPRRVMLALSLYVQHFDLASQQDAAEALIHLASALQEERGKYLEWLRPTLQSFVKAPFLREANSFIGGRNDSHSAKGGDQLLDSWRGHLPWPLEGTIASSLTCQRCGYNFSTQFQSFNDITLTPLCDREGNMIRGCSLESCLDHFTRPEWVDSVKCSNCSHKAALLSIFLSSGESMSTASTAGRTGKHKVSRSKVKYIEECGCDEECKCEAFTGEEGGVWRNIYTNASKQLKIGRSPQVICFQIQRVVMSLDGAMKKLTGHVTFPRVLDLFPYTVAAKNSIPLSAHGTRNINRESSFSKERHSRTSHSSYATYGILAHESSLLHAEMSCTGGADSDHLAPENRKTIDPEGKKGSREERSFVNAEVGSERMGGTFITAAASLFNLDITGKEEGGSESLSTKPANETEEKSEKIEDSALPSVAVDLGQNVPGKLKHLMDIPSILVAGAQSSTDEESTAQNIFSALIKPSSSSDEILVNEQEANRLSEMVEEFQSVQYSSPKNGGISSPTSNVVQPVYSQYTPRMFPPILLQQLSSFATPYEGHQLSADIHFKEVKKLAGLRSMPKKTTRFMPTSPRYSRNLLYQLVSVVVHQGGPQNGHYLVYRKVRIRGSKGNPTNEDVVFPIEPTDDEALAEKRNINSADSTFVPGEQPAKEVSTAEGVKVQGEVCQLFGVEFLPKITSSQRTESLRRGFSEDQELFECELLHNVSLADKMQAKRTSGNLLEECTNCTGICGRREDVDGLWFKISDTNVQRVQEQEVFGSQASLLFYEQL